MLDDLRGEDGFARWLKELENPDLPQVEATLPTADELPEVLLDLAVPHGDINELVALRRRLTGDRDLRWLLERAVSGLVHGMGDPNQGIAPRPLPDETDPLGRCFTVFVFVAALPHVRAYHRERGIPDDVSRRTLADLGRHLAVHRRRRGTCGLLFPWWNSLHFHGELYQLGRLQFQRTRLGGTLGPLVQAAGTAAGTGDPCLSLHIADFRGPLTPTACDASLTWAREFFPRYFPEERHEVAVCHSWLLDPQLKRYLPEESNIVRFQNRFRVPDVTHEPRLRPDDTAPVGFVFGDPDRAPDLLPRRTAVERAVGDHLRAGGHWYVRHGWFPM
ncbi:acyltransferase domain-containing protein [Streptomyces sp. NPDC058001]|uniref:acyltransferase domain-containing protein n=1 Tax=Streptomyces sp. NPDC058001 TaxID=3346300 RepID=UPI0036F09F42